LIVLNTLSVGYLLSCDAVKYSVESCDMGKMSVNDKLHVVIENLKN